MTVKELKKYLIENSPFKFKGDGKELFSFYKDSYSIDNGKSVPYKLFKTGDNFIFEDCSLIPVFQNIKIEVSDKDETTVILNFNFERLKNDLFRNKDAESGYLILQPLRKIK